ncbi:MAG: TAXI family TRAP transporter solute-binding subunit, partial [Candidatus Limnocylindria bacterium]|nr:TAXI family TRAP transporter solute-binding subunit [Candidatus Limnocylindria bacterium]
FVDHADSIRKMSDKYGPFYFPINIPKGTYKNESDIVTAGIANLLVVPAAFDRAFAQAILKTMFDSQADLATIHAEAKKLTLQSAVEGSPLDFHPGAIDFYKSRGVWKK